MTLTDFSTENLGNNRQVWFIFFFFFEWDQCQHVVTWTAYYMTHFSSNTLIVHTPPLPPWNQTLWNVKNGGKKPCPSTWQGYKDKFEKLQALANHHLLYQVNIRCFTGMLMFCIFQTNQHSVTTFWELYIEIGLVLILTIFWWGMIKYFQMCANRIDNC